VATTWGAWTETADVVSETFTFGLRLDNLDDVAGAADTSRKTEAAYCGANCIMQWYATRTGPTPDAGWPAAAQAAYTAWAATLGAFWECKGIVYEAAATAPGETPDIGYQWFVAGWTQAAPGGAYTWHGDNYWELAGGFTLTNVICKERTGADEKSYRAAIRNWSDLKQQALLFADGQTAITATIGTATATGDFDFPAGDEGSIAIGGLAGCLNLVQTHAGTGISTNYTACTNLAAGNTAVPLTLTNCKSWYHSGVWTFATADPGDSTWYFGVSGGDVVLHRLGGAGGNTGQASCQFVGPIRWNVTAKRFGDRAVL
jgi:hypothetical protein